MVKFYDIFYYLTVLKEDWYSSSWTVVVADAHIGIGVFDVTSNSYFESGIVITTDTLSMWALTTTVYQYKHNT